MVATRHLTLAGVAAIATLGWLAMSEAVPPTPNWTLEGEWVKHDRSVLEIFHINITCTACCIPTPPPPTPQPKCLPSYTGVYLDGPLAGHTTFNVSAVGDMMSATGTYANFADDSGTKFCPAPFALILEDDTNVALVTYGASYGTPCGDYTGDSARYYRKSALTGLLGGAREVEAL